MTSEKIFRPGSQEALIQKASNLNERKLMMGKYEFTFEPSPDVDTFYVEKAKKDLRENPETIAQGLAGLKEILRANPDLNVPHSDDYLVKFLRPCKWYPNSAFELMKRFFKFRINYPQYYDNLIPENDSAVFAAGILSPVPLRMSDGSRVFTIQGGTRWNPKKVTLTQLFRAVAISIEAALTEPKTQISGTHVVFDMEGLSLSHVTYFTPSFARAVLEWVQRCLPCRIKGIHIINQPYIFNMIFAIFKPFIHEKLRKRIHFHGTNRESLFNIIEPDAFPIMYGGKLDYSTELAAQNFWKFLCIFNEDFKEVNTYGFIKK